MLATTAGTSDYNWFLEQLSIQPIQPNWSLLIQDMVEKDMPLNKQALAIDVQWSTFQRWWIGSEPLFKNGLAVLVLHSKVCGINMTQQRLREFAEVD